MEPEEADLSRPNTKINELISNTKTQLQTKIHCNNHLSVRYSPIPHHKYSGWSFYDVILQGF